MNVKGIISSLFKAQAVLLVLAVLFPSAVKLTHTFNHHTHEICDSDNDYKTHFHESDLDCDFYKFKLTKTQFIDLKDNNSKLKFAALVLQSNYYISLPTHQQSTKFLRGPPQLV